MAQEVNVWSNVSVAAQTALAAAVTLEDISNANPGVVSATGHTFADGDVLLLKVKGMRQLNNRVVRVANKAADTFELEGIDTTNFGTFVSGTAQKITFGAEAATMQDVNGSGGEASPIPIGTIHDDEDIEIPGRKTAISYSFGSLWVPDDPCLLALKVADETKGMLAIRIGFASGAKAYFAAYPSVSMAPLGSQGGAVTTPVAFRLGGRITVYAS